MGLTQARPEKQQAIIEAAAEMRNALASVGQRHELNIAEAMTAATHALASVIAGAYRDDKSRGIAVGAIPDMLAVCILQWDKIYKDFHREHTTQ